MGKKFFGSFEHYIHAPKSKVEGETATIDAYLIEISLAMYYLSMSIIGHVLAISTDTVCQ